MLLQGAIPEACNDLLSDCEKEELACAKFLSLTTGLQLGFIRGSTISRFCGAIMHYFTRK